MAVARHTEELQERADQDIYDKKLDVVPLRAQVGMVFQKPNPFPKSIYDNIAYGPRIHGLAKNKEDLDEIVCLEAPRDFQAVSMYYGDFRQVSDAEVTRILDRSTTHGGTDAPVKVSSFWLSGAPP